TISASGGTAPYTYSLSGTTDADGIFTGLGAGTYTFVVTDANGCSDEVKVIISQPVVIACNILQPLILPAFNSTGNVLCATSSATAVSYKWTVTGIGWAITEGNTGTGSACIKYTTGNSGTSGTFSLTVTDINGCTTYCSIVIVPPAPISEGCTPGFWKNSTHYWDKANDPVSMRIAAAMGSPYNGTAVTGSLFSETFGLTSAQMKAVKLNTSLSLKQAINLGGGDFQKLARHATAALLSASGLAKYSHSISEVLTMTRNAILTKKAEPTASLLAAANEMGNCPISGSSKNPTIFSANEPVKTEIFKEVALIEDKLNLLVYPNPFVNEVNFKFTSPATGFATIEIFDIMGKKLSVVFKGNVEADMEQTAQFNVPAYSARTMLVYRLTVGDKVISGKVLPQ
ncbi:MAG TPA: T9SS type A sorting domain-containing protein, partial [Daejeonella sp.]|nr:T9SS type A sorting domain-containing protein [Daejeonella sp.]